MVSILQQVSLFFEGMVISIAVTGRLERYHYPTIPAGGIERLSEHHPSAETAV
jgi:hypothetical protein